MNTIKRIACFALALMLALPMFTSCANTFVNNAGNMTDKKTGITYTYVYTSVYQPIAVSTESYIIWKHNNVKINYYPIEGLEPTEWLYSDYGELLCSTGEELPSLEGFGAKGAFICLEGTSAVSLFEIKDKTTVDKIVEAYTTGEREKYPSDPSGSTFSLKFISDEYPEFYYNLILIAYADSTYLYDRLNGIYVNMGDLFDEYDLYGTYGYDD